MSNLQRYIDSAGKAKHNMVPVSLLVDVQARLALADRLAAEAEIVAHGLDETCGKLPELEKALAAYNALKEREPAEGGGGEHE